MLTVWVIDDSAYRERNRYTGLWLHLQVKLYEVQYACMMAVLDGCREKFLLSFYPHSLAFLILSGWAKELWSRDGSLLGVWVSRCAGLPDGQETWHSSYTTTYYLVNTLLQIFIAFFG